MTNAEVMAKVACPACAQQPKEWCAEWNKFRGMHVVEGLVHPERIEAAQFVASVETGASPDTHNASAQINKWVKENA